MRTFIQPYLDGTKLTIFVSTDKNGKTKIKVVDKDNNKYSLKQHYLKDVKKCYAKSKYHGFDIVLFCTLVFDKIKQKEKLIFTDILLQCNYDGIQQSMKYNVRHDNLVCRFFTLETKNCSVVQSVDTQDACLMNMFEKIHFKSSNGMDKVTYHLDVPYGFSGEVHSEQVAHIETMKIIGGNVGITKVATEDSTEDDPKSEDKEYIESFICETESGSANVDISTIPMKDRIEMVNYFEKDIEGRTCKCLVYYFCEHSGRSFVEMN